VNFTLVHVQQEGIADVLHHIWTMENVPTFFYARTELNTEMLIDWEKMLSGNYSQAISFNKEPQYFAAVLIFKVYKYLNLHPYNYLNSYCSFLCIMISMILV
jgi:hypothetical protein